jgi:hypothetical protein
VTTVIAYNNTALNEIGKEVLNFTQQHTLRFTIAGKAFNVTLNFITPTTAGVTINGKNYTLTVGVVKMIDDPPGYGWFANLTQISYLPILHSINLALYQVPLVTSSTTSASSSTSSTTSASSSTASTTQTTITLVQTTLQPQSGSTPPEVLIENELLVGLIIAVAFLLAYAGISAKRKGNKGGATPTQPPAAT